MADATATSPFAAARDGVRAADERLDALGPAADALFEALAKRLGALPASAVFTPFGALGSMAQALAAQSSATAAAAPKRADRASGKGAVARRPPAPPLAPLRNPGSFANLGAAPARGANARSGPPVPDIAGSLIVEPALEAMRTLARLTQPSPTKAAPDSLLQAPAAIAQQVAQWLAQHIEQAAAPSLVAGGASIGSALAGLLSSQELLARSLAGLAPAARRPTRQPRASRSADVAGPPITPQQQAVATAARPASPELAPRAGSKLLTPEPASAQEGDGPPAGRAREPADPAAPGADDGPIDAMTRALVDQAWLRGVDLR